MATTPGYIFGAGTDIATPEELANRRRWAQAMVRSGTERTPQDPWEGLASLARAVSGSYSNFKADEEEQKGVASANEAYRPLAEALANNTTPSGEHINTALSNPWMSDGQKMIAQQLFKNQYGDNDGDGGFGLNPIWGKDAKGNPVLFQPSKSGGVRPIEFPEGVTPTPTLSFQDMGTYVLPVNPKTGTAGAPMPKDVAGEAAQKELGKGQGEAQAAAPGAAITAEQTVQKIDELLADPELSNVSGWQSWLPDYGVAMVSGSHALGLRRRVEQLKGTAFLEAYNGLRGGGQITEVEGKKAEDAIARLETAQNDEDYRRALMDFRDAVVTGYAKLAARAGGNAPRLKVPDASSGDNPFSNDPQFGQVVNGYKIGSKAKNPQTGEVIFWDGNGWRP